MKKFISVCIVLIFCCSCFSLVAVAETNVQGDYEYVVTDGEATIVKYKGNGGNITIPDTLGGAPVKVIGVSAFSGCEAILSVAIPHGVTLIGGSAFSGCTGLTRIEFPDSVKTIGRSAFSSCSALTAVTIPDGVTVLGEGAFSHCSALTDVTLGTGVATMGGEITTFGDSAFLWCSGLTRIQVKSGNAFYKSIDGVLFSKDGKNLLQYPAKKAGDSYTIPAGVITVGAYAFRDSTNLTSVTIPDSVKTLGCCSFYNCSQLSDVTLPDEIYIQESVFENTPFAGEDEVDSLAVYQKMVAFGRFYQEHHLAIAFFVGFLLISVPFWLVVLLRFIIKRRRRKKQQVRTRNLPPEQVVQEGAFCYCVNSQGVTITKYMGMWGDVVVPDTLGGVPVTQIGNYAFYGCRGLRSVILPHTVTLIGYGAFSYCQGLMRLVVPQGLERVDDQAFYGCSALEIVQTKAQDQKGDSPIPNKE